MPRVDYPLQEKTVIVPAGTNLLDASARAGVAVEGNCGGRGTCGKCRIRLAGSKGGDPDPAEAEHLSAEELAAGWVLACRRTVVSDTVVEVRLQDDAHHRKASLTGEKPGPAARPCLRKIAVALPRPTAADQAPDLERLLAGLPGENLSVRLAVLAALPRTLREADFTVTAVLAGDNLIAVEPGDTTGRLYGLACDIGTTTIMGSLIDLHSGAILAAGAATNPQGVYGADVISRIMHASRNTDGLAQLQEKVIGAVNGIMQTLLAQAGVIKDEVYEAAVVGNTTMSHLFLGIDPAYLAPAPFIPAFRRPVEVEAAGLGLSMHPGGRVLVLPNIAGYVGSDTVGVILATRLDRRADTCLAMDIGTNGELVLAAGGRLLACSTAAGPAFEGARIKHGMRAADGAIESVRVDGDGTVHLEVIGGGAPRGICGSGLIDTAAALLAAGVIEESGRYAVSKNAGGTLPPRLTERLRRGKDGWEFVLAGSELSSSGEAIVLTQGDLRELQLAKGAIRAGLQVLLKEAGLTEAALDTVLLAGAFGNYLRRESALAVGLLPPMPVERIIPVGNAAGDGARLALVSGSERERAFALPGLVEHVELSTRPDFQEAFIKALTFPPIDDSH